MGLTKAQLEQLNDSSFPNNNAGAITPAILRDFNTEVINNTVNQDVYSTDSASVDSRLDTLEAFSSSLDTTFATDAQLNASSSTLQSNINTKLDTASFNSYSASNASVIAGLETTASYQIDSASFSSRIDNVSAPIGYVTTSSFNAYTQSTNTFTASVSTSVGSLQTFSGSQYKADSASFSSRIVAAENTGYVTTASFNSYTQSVTNTIATLATTASVNTLSSSIFQTDSTQSNAITNNSASAATALNTFSASNYQTDATQSNNISALSSSNAFAHSTFATTGSNTFNGNQTINGAISASGNISASSLYVTNATIVNLTTVYETSSVIYSSGSNQLGDELTDVQILSGSVQIVGSGSINGSRIITSVDTASMAVSSSLYSVTSSYAVFAQTASEARNVVVIARNGNQSTLGAGTVVRITGASGDNPIFNTASYDTETLSSNTLGILRNSSPSGADVEVVVNGIVLGVNTDPALGYVAGDVLYLSASGQFTKTPPQAPQQTVTLGEVLRAQKNNGSIYVNVSNGWELNELHNVQINTPLTNDILAYESSSYGLWKNKSISSLGLTTTSSFNSFTQSISSSVDSISSSVGLLQTFSSSQYKADSASFDTRINSAGGASQILDEGTILGTATSFNFNGAGVTATINSGTASITIPGGGGSINTSSFATTGSNTFIGDQVVTGSITLSENSNLTVSNGGVTKLENTWVKALITTSSVTIKAGGLISTGSIYSTNDIYATQNVYSSGSITALGNISASGNIFGANLATFATTGSNTFTGNQTISGSITLESGKGVFGANNLITTGSATTASQTIKGDLTIDTTYTANNPYLSGVGGSNIIEVGYGDIFNGTQSGNDFIYWLDTNFNGVTVSGTGITNGVITGYNYGGNGVEVSITTGTITNGATYTFTGPAFQMVEITGSIATTQKYTAKLGSNSSELSANSLNIVSTNFAGGAGAGVLNVQTADSNDRLYMNISSSVFNAGAEWGGAQFSTVYNGAEASLIGFQTQKDWTDGRITMLRPLVAQSGSIVTGSVDISGSLVLNGVNITGETINTSSFATTGSNLFVGKQGITGSIDMKLKSSINLYQLSSSAGPETSGIRFYTEPSASNNSRYLNIQAVPGTSNAVAISDFPSNNHFQFYYLDSHTIVNEATTVITNTPGTSQLTLAPTEFNLNTTKTGSAANGFIFGPTGSFAQQTIGVYDDPNFTTDVENRIKVSSAGIEFGDWDNGSTFDYVPYLTIEPNTGNDPALQFKRDIAVSGSVSITEVMNLKPQNPLPTGNIGDLAVSGSSLYFYNGAWTLVV